MAKSMRQYTYDKQQQVNAEREAWESERAEAKASAEKAEAEEYREWLHDREFSDGYINNSSDDTELEHGGGSDFSNTMNDVAGWIGMTGMILIVFGFIIFCIVALLF